MTKFKKIIPALCMLLISAVLMGTSTYAWFSMNTTVSASNMAIKAQSNSSYLMIGSTADIGTTKTDAKTELAHTASGAKVYPCALNGSSAITDGAAVSPKTLVEANAWYTANSSSSSNATENVKNYKTVTLGDAKYFTTYTMYLTLSADSENFKGELAVDFALAESNSTAISAYVVVGESESFATKLNMNTTNNSGKVSNFVVTKSTTVKVTVYVYIDGTNADVTSQKITDSATALDGIVGLTFTIGDNQNTDA